MRTTISLFVTSFVFGSLAVNFQGIGNSLVNQMFSLGDQELLLSRSKPPQGKDKAPHRGSGRREFVECLNHA